jgi:hypothetical protein
MKLRNQVIYGAGQALSEMETLSLPVKASLALIKLTQDIKPAFDKIEKVRNDLVGKHGKKEKGNPNAGITSGDKNWDAFVLEFNELMEEKSDVKFTKVTLPQEVNGKPLVVSITTVRSLIDFINFQEEK